MIGQWDGKPDHDIIDITVNKTAVTDKGEETTFHSISNLTEMVSGQHYIFAVKDGGKYYALAYDENRYVTPVELEMSDEGSYTLEVSKQDLEYSDFVLTSTSAGTVSANKATDLKFVTNYKDPTGKSIYLKLGNSDIDQTMFSTSNGIIEISGQDNQYQVKHTDVTRVLMFDSSGQKFGFAYNTGSNIIILTDAEVTPEKPPEGEQQFVQVDASDLYYVDKPLLFTYEVGGTYYALTAKGAQPISAPEGQREKTVIVDFSMAWTPMSAMNSGYDYSSIKRSFYSFAGFRQGDNYLDPATEGLVSSTDEEVYLLTQYDNSYFPPKTPIISDANSSCFIGWDNENKSFISTNQVDKAIQFELYAYQPGYTLEKYYPVNDLSHIEKWSKILITCKDANDNDCILVPGAGSNGLGLSLIAGSSETDKEVYYGNEGKTTIKARSKYGLTVGNLKSVSKQMYKLAALRWSDLGEALYVDGYQNKDHYFLASDDKECVLTYNSTGDIILRGAKQWLVYDAEQNITTSSSQKDATPIQIWSVGEPPESDNVVTVNFYDASNNLETTSQEAQGSLVLPGRADVKKDGVTYTFVGWSTKEDQATYLELGDSCDLYDFNDTTNTGSIKTLAAQKLGIIGHCNPEKTDSIDPSEYATKSGQLNLYPVYAVKVTAPL